MNRLDKYGYKEFKEALINKDEDIIDEIFELRSQDMGMFDISDTLIKRHVVLDYYDRKLVEDLMCCDGGVYDILLPKPKDGYDLDGMKNLASAVMQSAVDAYGYAVASNAVKQYPSTEKFFTSGTCDLYLGVFGVNMTGKDVMAEVHKRVANGEYGRRS